MPDRLTEAAPAKVNLYLHLTGRRDDGYHLLDSLVAFAEIGDVLRAEPAETLSLRVAGPFAGGVSAESDNLVLRAARALATEAGNLRAQVAYVRAGMRVVERFLDTDTRDGQRVESVLMIRDRPGGTAAAR